MCTIGTSTKSRERPFRGMNLDSPHVINCDKFKISDRCCGRIELRGKTMTITGGCLCGAIRYESTVEPIITRICWCRVCQYLGAGSGTVNVCFPTASFTVKGDTRDFGSIADSGNVMHRRFCSTCGTQLFSEAEARPHLIFVRAGTLDNPEIAKPAATIWTSQAPSWACISEEIPKVDQQPPPAA
jgi:hypothetical protein